MLLLVGDNRYPVDLVKVHESWPGHHGHPKKKKTPPMIAHSLRWIIHCLVLAGSACKCAQIKSNLQA